VLVFRALLPSGFMLYDAGKSGLAWRLCSASNLSRVKVPNQPVDGGPDTPPVPHEGDPGLCAHLGGAVRQRERLTDA
jgi:hypothetical protein